MGGLRSRAVRTVLALLATAALAACSSSAPGPIHAGSGDGVQSSQHAGNKHKHNGKQHHQHHKKHHHKSGSGHGGGNGGNGGGGGGNGGGNGGGGGGNGGGGGGNGGGGGGNGGGNGGGGNGGGGGGNGGGGGHHGGGGGSHSSSPPPPSTASVTVTPHSGLTNGQSVHVVGTGFQPNEQLIVIECVDHGEQTGPNDCRVFNGKYVKSSASGTVDEMLSVFTKVNSQTCGSPIPCLVSVAPPSQSSHADEADEHISFG